MPVTAVKILLVEDNPNDVELTLYALRKHDLADSVEVVRDGAEALDFIHGRGKHETRVGQPLPRLILLDLKLPKIDGAEVLGKVKSNPATRHIPVVVLTSSNQDSDIVRCYELGANSYVVKPVDFEEFTASVRDLGNYWLGLNRLPHM